MSYFTYHHKRIYYSVQGNGKPLMFLHGNTASSKMFDYILPLYADDYKIILIDFMGNGKSDRIDAFPDELWIDQGQQVVALAKLLHVDNIYLLGTSGGAYAAINAALLEPQLFRGVIADSFDGRTLPIGFGDALIKERTAAKQDAFSRGFYEWCQGDDWEAVVDADTRCLLQIEKEKLPLFLDDISDIQVPLWMLASRSDHMLMNDLDREFQEIASPSNHIYYHIFDEGDHPLIATKAEEVAKIVKEFITS